jgi:hypothetical protein
MLSVVALKGRASTAVDELLKLAQQIGDATKEGWRDFHQV